MRLGPPLRRTMRQRLTGKGDPLTVAGLAREAEEAGWDGAFYWDLLRASLRISKISSISASRLSGGRSRGWMVCLSD